LQTREQHIRRDKATSNVCTAQVLLAVMASMYAVYHGPGGLRRIADRVHSRTVVLANALRRLRYRVVHDSYFDTLCVEVPEWALPRLLDAARARMIHLRQSENEMLRYIKRLEARDLSLTSAMIPLGSCTMKLNATTEMMPVSWREFNRLHPFAPRDQAAGYDLMFRQLEHQLAEITGF